jgi:hypothetical protein
MPRVYSQKARKDYPQQGIKKGDIYYQWCKRPGGRGKGITYKSLTRPTRAQLTSSDFLSTVYGIFDAEFNEPSDFENAAEEVRTAGEECQEKLDNMPESLQYAPSGEMLQTRIDSCEEAASMFEEIASTLEEKLTEIQEKEDAWTKYNEEMETWAAKGLELGLDSVDWDTEYTIEDCPEDGDSDDFGSWLDARPETPSDEEEDWDAARAEALEEARSEVNEPDWG